MNTRLSDYWDQITPDPPALDDLVDGGQRIRRRRRWSVAGAAALTLAVIAGGVAVQQLVADGDNAIEPAQLIPTPPDGTRWVGAGGAVLAVPEWWSTGETQCLTPVETTVAWFSGAVADCVDPVPDDVTREVSFLEVMDATSGYGEYMMSTMEPIDPIHGVEVLEATGCNDWYVGTCRRLFAVPSAGIVFAVALADAEDGDYEAIRDSLRVLPDGATTVPLDAGLGGYTPGWGDEPEVVRALLHKIDAAGLRAEVVFPPPPGPGADLASFPPGSYLGSSPELGSPIEDGGTVMITVAPVPLPTNGWRPGDGADQALVSGKVAIDDDGCVYLANAGQATYVLWPAGYATQLVDGVIAIVDEGGREVARVGQEIRAGGGASGVGRYEGEPCLPETGGVFSIQDQVRKN